jgi:hypothetical protein
MTPAISVLLVALIAACSKSDGKRASVDQPSGDRPAPVNQPASSSAGTSAAQDPGIVVNGQALSAETVQQLKQIYPVVIPSGRYWYYPVSGAWGREGQPIAGQMMPGLSLGGPLQATASRGTSGVFINGRQITDGEKSYIEVLCQSRSRTAGRVPCRGPSATPTAPAPRPASSGVSRLPPTDSPWPPDYGTPELLTNANRVPSGDHEGTLIVP